MRSILDTNVLVSALLMPASKPRLALDLARSQGKILVSFGTLTELQNVLNRPRFRRYVDPQDIRHYLAALAREAEWLEPQVEIRACRDPKDDQVLSLVVSGQATHLVTGDLDLLALNPFQGIRILTPGDFLLQP